MGFNGRRGAADISKESTDMLNWKRTLALMAVPATLAVGVVSVTAHAAGTQALTTQATSEPAEVSSAEKPEAAGAEAKGPSLPGGGHSDGADQVDQFEGTE